MADKKCPHCASMIPAEAKICPQCRKRQGLHWGWKLLIGLGILYIIGSIFGNTNNSSSVSPNYNVYNAQTNDPVLELQSWRWGERYSHVIAEGAVKNISSNNLKNVTAVVQFYDKHSTFISSADALIEYNPILPGQTSPFKVIGTWNPEMKQASIDFKSLMGGTILFVEKPTRNKK